MGFFGIGKEISDPVKAVGNALDSLFTSDEERANAQIVLEKLRLHPQILQAEISKLEATSLSLWVAGARPYIIWVAGSGLLFAFIVNPILQWIFKTPGPELPINAMMNLVIAILGLGGLRTYEKIKGVAR